MDVRMFDKVGTLGNAEDVVVSMIPFMVNNNDGIHQYVVEFTPDIENGRVRYEKIKEEFSRRKLRYVFDGKIIYLRESFDQFTTEVTHSFNNQKCKMAVKHTRSFEPEECINVYNLIMRRCYDNLKFVQLGRYYYDVKNNRNVQGYDIEIIPGYETAVRLHDTQLQLNVETRFKVIRKSSVLDLINNLKRVHGGHLEKLKNCLEEQLVGKSMMASYNNKILRCDEVRFDLTVDSEFIKDGVRISLRQYYKDTHNRVVTDDSQPILITNGSPAQPGEAPRQTFLIPEFLIPTGLTEEMRNDYKTMSAVAQHTRLSPNDRVKRARSLLTLLRENQDSHEFLSFWGITLGDDLASATARLLGPQTINTGLNSFKPVKGEWSRDMKRNSPFKSIPLKTWAIVGTELVPGSPAEQLSNEIMRLGRELRIEVSPPVLLPAKGQQQQNFEFAIRDGLRNAKENNMEIDCLVVLLPNDNASRYNAVKKLCCADGGCPSQCINLAKLIPRGRDGTADMNKFKSIVLKIFLQMQCKMGGALWKMNIPMKNAMILGYDVYHDSSLRGTTIGACVSTTDENYVHYYSQTKKHNNPAELGSNLYHFVRKALRKYYTCNNNTLPENLILYRDGAGDGQIPHIKEVEVKLVQEACDYATKRIDDSKTIKLSFIVVAKKVNLRLYKKTGNDFANPLPGTVIDTVVTRPDRFDFYMIPQPVNQGTVTPVSYNIIFNNTDLDANKHQSLAFKLCHMYYNWQGTVRVPAPCQYAHKMAFLVSQSLHMEANEGLRNKLFFL